MRSGTRLWILLLPLLSACWVVRGNGERAEEARPVAAFDVVESHGALDVLVERGETFSLTVSIDSNLFNDVETEVVDGVLRINLHEGVFHIVPGPHVRVTMPHLTALTLKGSGDVDAFRFDETAPVRLRLSGSGNLNFEGSAPALTASLDGSGDLDLTGSAGQLTLDVDGSGDLNAKQCPGTSAELSVDGSGDLSSTVNGDVSASVRGSGDIDIFGAATLTHSSVRGSGDIHKR